MSSNSIARINCVRGIHPSQAYPRPFYSYPENLVDFLKKSSPSIFGFVCTEKKFMRRSALACLGAHLLQASGFYHGETLPVLSPEQAHPEPPVSTSSPTDLPFEAVRAGNSTAREERSTKNSTVAQGHHVFNADEISWNSSGDESPPSHGALSDFHFLHPNANPTAPEPAPVSGTSNETSTHSASHKPHVTDFQLLHPQQLALNEHVQCQDDSSFLGHLKVKTNADHRVLKTVDYSCADWVGLTCDEDTAIRCKVGLQRLEAVRAACPDTCQLCKGTLSAGPTFKYGGKWFKSLPSPSPSPSPSAPSHSTPSHSTPSPATPSPSPSP